jgi:hypothetical protein
MEEELRFLRESIVDVDAAVVGISSARWIAIPASEAIPENAAPIMKAHRFDVLPIVASSVVTEYFRTDELNTYTSISRMDITHRDVIPFDTRLRDVIRGFALDSRRFYFLSNNRRIVGLLPVANLNCRAVKVYLFSLLAELEIQMGRFVLKYVSEPDLLRMTLRGPAKPKHETVRRQYDTDKANGLDLPIVEYLYLSDLINIVAAKKLYSHLGFSGRKRFEECLGPVNSLRSAVAHPSRSLISNEKSCKRLWEQVDRVDEALFILGRVY